MPVLPHWYTHFILCSMYIFYRSLERLFFHVHNDKIRLDLVPII